MCGWTSSIAYRGDDQNTEFDALQVTLAQQMHQGLAVTANYQWASAFDEQSGYYTWSHTVTHGRDSNVRDQQLTAYGSYDLPFGKGKQFAAGANRLTDLMIGGCQLSGVLNWSGGLPFTLSYNESRHQRPRQRTELPERGTGRHLKTSWAHGRPVSRSFVAQQSGRGNACSIRQTDRSLSYRSGHRHLHESWT